MDEENMWRGFHAKLTEMKSNPPTEHDAKFVDFLHFNFTYNFFLNYT